MQLKLPSKIEIKCEKKNCGFLENSHIVIKQNAAALLTSTESEFKFRKKAFSNVCKNKTCN